MKALKIGGIGLVGLVLLFVAVGLFLPRKLDVSRSVVIEAPPERVFVQVNDVRRHEAWSPWKAADPTVVNTFPPSGESVGEGAWYSWTSEHSGAGTMTITRSDPPHGIEGEVEFERGRKASVYYRVETTDTGTRLTWGFGADAGCNIPHRYMGLFADSLMGPWLEDGLDRLKKLVEAEPPQGAVLPAEQPRAQPSVP